MRQKSFVRLVFFWLWLALPPHGVAARVPDLLPYQICDTAAAQAARDSGVPLGILHSIARVESGRSVQGQLTAWPWSVNRGGKGAFFANQDQAMTFAAQLIATGDINFDVGCFQINLRWHSKGFTSLDDAFDPFSNAAYAAEFLQKLFHETGDWPRAVASYHSRNAEHAQPYLAKVKSVWRDLQSASPPPDAPAQPARGNPFPLLLAGRGANGSLVPKTPTQFIQFSLK